MRIKLTKEQIHSIEIKLLEEKEKLYTLLNSNANGWDIIDIQDKISVLQTILESKEIGLYKML